MNLTRVLNNALPELPARALAERPPRIDPEANSREHIEEGQTIIRAYIPSAKSRYTFPPDNWRLAQLFDGKRSYEEIAEIYSRDMRVEYSAEQVREFAEELDQINFWYRTAQEKNILLMQQSAEERRKKLKQQTRWADLSDVLFPAFNPDPFLTKFCRYTKFVYTPWFTALTLSGFAVTAWITITHRDQIGRDTVHFYNFTNKSWGDIIVLYVILCCIVVVHELAHAYTSKHYGGRVTAMGFALVYLTPAVYTDTTEADVMATRYQRLMVTIAGVWSELMICSVATIIWWGTAPDTAVHDAAYFMMMLTGIVSILLNWNPLMKLDGYYMLTDITGISDIKENSTAYVSAWVKKHIWRLPVEIPYVPKRRRLGFVIYALLSGVYSYTVLYILARFVGNIVRNFSPEWGFVPEIGVALMIFRSRIRLLGNFMKFVYLDKKDRIIASFTPRNSALAAVALIVLLALPLWRQSATGRFLLEPTHVAEVRAFVPGLVAQLNVGESDQVNQGALLATLRDSPLQSDLENAQANLLMASDRAKQASLRYSDYGVALTERERMSRNYEQVSEMVGALELRSPIAGIVITPRVQDRLGSYLREGQELLVVADVSSLRARIYVSEYDLRKVRNHAVAQLQVQGLFKTWGAHVTAIAARPTELDPSLSPQVELQGTTPPHFYVVDLNVPNSDGLLKPGMTGFARVYGVRRSALGLGWEAFADFFGRKIW